MRRPNQPRAAYPLPVNFHALLGCNTYFSLPVDIEHLLEHLQAPPADSRYVIVSKRTKDELHVTTMLDARNAVLYRAQHPRGVRCELRRLAAAAPPKAITLLQATESYVPNPLPKI